VKFHKYQVIKTTKTIQTIEIQAESGEEAKQLVEEYEPSLLEIVKTEVKVSIRQPKRLSLT
jgi:hypothetical protein